MGKPSASECVLRVKISLNVELNCSYSARCPLTSPALVSAEKSPQIFIILASPYKQILPDETINRESQLTLVSNPLVPVEIHASGRSDRIRILLVFTPFKD